MYHRSIVLICLFTLFLVGCSSTPKTTSATSNSAKAALKSTKITLASLNSQYKQWQGTPYQYGGQSRKGIDCSGFVQITFKEQFNIQLPRSTKQQMTIGRSISRHQLKAGDLVFFKIGNRANVLHVGIYEKQDQFIHASTSKGVIRSSLQDHYWQKHYWQARRL